MRVILVVVVVAIGWLIGKNKNDSYKKKKEFYFSAYQFCIEYETNLKFNRLTVDELISKVNFTSDVFSNALAEYFKNNAVFNDNIYNESQKQVVNSFFNDLGKSNAYSELNKLSYYKSEFEKSMKDAEENYKIKGMLAQKVGVLAGLLVGILIL
ncbi:MAG: hypothetical protein RR086_03235 [Clostridia bacterium]